MATKTWLELANSVNRKGRPLAAPFFFGAGTLTIDTLRIAAAAFKSAYQSQDRNALVAAAARLVELDAPLGQQWQSLAHEVFRWNELTLALRALDTWERQGTAGPLAAYDRATTLARVGKAEEALGELGKISPDAPSPAANAYLHGALATNLGRRDVADREFRRALKAAPDSGRSWVGLAQLGTIGPRDEAAMDRLGQTIARAAIEDRAGFAKARGMLEHSRGNHAAAFAAFAEANTIERERFGYDAADNRASAQVSMSWTAQRIAELAEPPPDGARRPIFVTGIARSGTTLVESILGAHSKVDGGGELGLAISLEGIAGGFGVDDLKAYLAGGGSVAHLRDTYLRLVGERIEGGGVFIDKTLNQSRTLGPMSVLFPDAPVVWMRRNPVENAFSIFRTNFSNNVVASWNLEELADHMRVEDRLHDHWAQELGGRMLSVPYEDLVDDPRRWTERITRHCGLAVEEGQFEFHRNRRAVTTASALQVRQPINRSALGAAEPYREFLQPFIEAYER